MQCHPRDGERSENRTDTRSAVEDAGGQRTLFGWKPFSGRLDCSWEIAALAQPEEKTGHTEAEDRRHKSMAHGREAPHPGNDGITAATTETQEHGPWPRGS